MLRPAKLNEGLHLPIHPFGAGGIGGADDNQAVGGAQSLVNGVRQHPADRQLFRIPERPPDFLIAFASQGRRQTVVLHIVEGLLRDDIVQILVTVTEENIVIESLCHHFASSVPWPISFRAVRAWSMVSWT